MSDDVSVNPAALVRVTYDLSDGETTTTIEVVALACHYVVETTHTARKVIGIEIVFDPEIQAPRPLPTEVYLCPAERLTRVILPPRNLRLVTPVAPVEASP